MSRRVAIGIHEISRVMGGEQTIFLRPLSSFFSRVETGERMWIAEPFHLEHRFDGLAPTVARDRGAVPAFAADYAFRHPDQLARTHGQRHPARSLCREWHRAHVVITSRTELLIQDLDDADIAQLGFRTRTAFAAHWDKEAALVGLVRFKVHHNPRVLRFGFTLVRKPIAFAPRPEPKKRGRPPGPSRPVKAAPPAVAVAPASRIVAPAPRPVAPPPAPVPAAANARPIGQQAPAAEIFSTERGDAAFLAALKRERPHAHAQPGTITSGPVRIRTMPAVMSPTGACPTCGTRFAFGCQHHPLTPEAAE